jgi:phosphohistidine phosphatase
MELILWRHAEAEVGGPDLPDAKRRLTERGDKQARDVARWLRAHLPKRCRILVSPAERTQETAHRLHLPYEIEPKVGVGETASTLLTAAGWPRGDDTVLVIGHQPTLGEVAAKLLGCTGDGLAVKKGGLWWFARRERGGEAETVLKAVINPGFL